MKIEELGISVDSTAVRTAADDLNKLAEAAERATAALKALGAATTVDVQIHAVGDVSHMAIKGRG